MALVVCFFKYLIMMYFCFECVNFSFDTYVFVLPDFNTHCGGRPLMPSPQFQNSSRRHL